MTTLEAAGTATGTASASVTARVKHNFSRQHFAAAGHFAILAVAAADGTEQSLSVHRANVSGSVVFATAFLEASINELFLEAKDNNNNTLAGLIPSQIHILAELWDTVEQHSILGKYQIALAACGKDRFDKGGEPFQGADALVKMRNALIHYRPEWDDELEEHKKLQVRLSDRFSPNPLMAAGSLWFPHLCMGAGCAQWAVRQVAEFSKEFCARMSIPSRA